MSYIPQFTFAPNIGTSNYGRGNIGNRNHGELNIGSTNIGSFNGGHSNIGNYNYGNGNIGNRNSGDCNVGHDNRGSCNVASFHDGHFNTVFNEGGFRMFNQPADRVDIKALGFPDSLLNMRPVYWSDYRFMSRAELEANPDAIETLGRATAGDRRNWWPQMLDFGHITEAQIRDIRAIQNFNDEIFTQIFNFVLPNPDEA